jgi:hypothetical protein
MPAQARTATRAAAPRASTAILLQWLVVAALVCMLVDAALPPPEPALYALPLLLVLVPLIAGRYPGERALESLVRRRRHRQARPAAAAPRLYGRRAPAVLGGRLVACSLGGRGPPLLLVRA